jgi:hypothetical protein
VVNRKPGRDRREVGLRRLDLAVLAGADVVIARNVSWTMSSASATLPSIRYAIENSNGRSSA